MAEMDMDAIIGLDFMVTHYVIIDVVGMIMHIKGKTCPLVKLGELGCFRVIVTERVPVPSRSYIRRATCRF